MLIRGLDLWLGMLFMLPKSYTDIDVTIRESYGSGDMVVSSSDSDSDNSDAELDVAISPKRKRKKRIRRIIDDTELGERPKEKLQLKSPHLSEAGKELTSFIVGNDKVLTWTAECDQAFGELKAYMSRASLLSTPEAGDVLTIYLSVSATAVSSVLIRPHECAEHPIHYVSKGLQDAEARYPDIKKLAFALVVSVRRLRPYFQAHTIHVLTNQLLRQVLQKPETSGRLVKWAIELGEFDIHYKPRQATKGQAVDDFIYEFTEPHTLASPHIAIKPTPTSNQVHVASNDSLDLTQPLWTLYVDGSSNA
ncbi:unnamed protein product [Prunus armeniaca]